LAAPVALVIPETVTVTLNAPAGWAGVMAVIWVGPTTATPTAAVPPTFTTAPRGPNAKFVPVIVIGVPPAIEPLFGLTAVTVGGAMYVKMAAVALVCPDTVTVTLAAPAGCADVVAVIDVALTTTTPVAGDPPTSTVAPPAKFVPLIVIAVPPSVEPLVGLTPVTAGAGTTYV
jgi:hypothetical protein